MGSEVIVSAGTQLVRDYYKPDAYMSWFTPSNINNIDSEHAEYRNATGTP